MTCQLSGMLGLVALQQRERYTLQTFEIDRFRWQLLTVCYDCPVTSQKSFVLSLTFLYPRTYCDCYSLTDKNVIQNYLTPSGSTNLSEPTYLKRNLLITQLRYCLQISLFDLILSRNVPELNFEMWVSEGCRDLTFYTTGFNRNTTAWPMIRSFIDNHCADFHVIYYVFPQCCTDDISLVSLEIELLSWDQLATPNSVISDRASSKRFYTLCIKRSSSRNV